jgi:hypothetical protein
VSRLILVDVYSRVDFKTLAVATESAGNHDRDNDRVKQKSSATEIEVN